MRVAAGLFAAFVCSTALAALPAQRTLSFEERVNAQAAIERVYYVHQIGATKPFDEAVPRAMLEKKVRKYLEQTVALQTYWKTAVTDETLQRELERMAQGTRMPERLQELYTALGNDPFLIKECLARATLVDRLTHNFYAFDSTMHANARAQATAIHRRLVMGELSPSTDHPNRRVSELVVDERGTGATAAEQPLKQRLTSEEFRKRRAEFPARVGEVSAVKETSDAFELQVPLSQSATDIRVASYVMPKTTWDAWWETARPAMQSDSVHAVASGRFASPVPGPVLPLTPRMTCPGDDTWSSWTLRELPTPRRNHSAVWTGSVMVVWGGLGEFNNLVNSGSRYDPATDTWLSTSIVGAPSSRQGHRAVWTGASMVVWGGRGPANSILGDGGRYDPVTDAWLPVSTVAAPPERAGFTAIWTGNRMVVWGGSNGSGFPAVGGRYDPVNDTWASTSTVDAPTPRSGHSAVWTGSRMIVWGGVTPTNTATGALYDPVNDAWTATSTLNAPAARAGHSAVWTGSVMVVWGGSSAAVFGTGGRYDPVNDSWSATSTTNTPSARSGQVALWTGSVMVVWGGNLLDPSGESVSYPTDGGRYDPVSDTWAPTSLLGAPLGRSGHTSVWTGSVMLVWGGIRSEPPEFVNHALDSGARYDPTANTWTPMAFNGTPRARYVHSAIWTGNVMVIWGGTNGNTDFNVGGRYDPVTDDWAGTSLVGAPSGRYLHSAVWTGDSMLIWGGEARSASPSGDLNDGAKYNPIADTWAPISAIGAPSKRAGAATVWTGNEMLVWSGFTHGTYSTTGGRYNPVTDTWRSMSSQAAPSGRYYASAIWSGRLMVVWGGNAYPQPNLDTGGRYDPAADKWTPTSAVGAPSARWVHSTVWTGHEMVVWGGWYDSGESNTGGRYNPVANSWTPTSTTGAPSARGDHAAIWTGREMVLWGGYGGEYLATGGRYDPSTDTWTTTSTVGAPSARTGHSAVWDGREMLVWGGYENASPFILVDTGGSYLATPGESCNGIDDDCDGAVDDGGDALCDDDNPCTDDSCNGSGGCGHVANEVPCNDDNPCTAADTCGSGACVGTPLTGTACEDGNACTTNDSCVGGECTSGSPRVCEDGNLCTDDSCNAATGCFVVGPRTCDDDNDCTDDSCDPATGCVFLARTGPCDDGSPCTQNDTCLDGHCVAETPCDDSNPCTDDICYPWGCYWVPNSDPCDDGSECTTGDHCTDGWCNGAYRDCDDGNSCTDDECNSVTGECIHINDDWNYCTDGDLCTLGEACRSGVCTGSTPLDCYSCPEGFEPIGTLCRRSFDITGDYLFNQSPVCNTARTRINDCEGGTYGIRYVDPGANLIPVAIDLQFMAGISCDLAPSSITLNGTPIGEFAPTGVCACFPPLNPVSFFNIDADAYVPGELNTFAIKPSGDCEGLSLGFDQGRYFGRITVTYALHDRRCEVSACEPATGACTFSTLPDGTACSDACTEVGACVGGACDAPTVNCDDGNACTDDSCDPATGCVNTPNNNSCDDGNACTIGDSCSAGACVAGATNTCDDHSPCTDDSCNPATGCVHIVLQGSCDDRNLCTSADHCVAGLCVGTPETGIPCDDGDACFTGEMCFGGVCYGGETELNCDDNNACSEDYCDHQTGCLHDSSQLGDLCDDGDPCTVNACDPLLFCVFPPGNEGGSCDDANACTHDDRCGSNGVCVGRSVCDDQNPCTDDYAAEASCACTHEPTHVGTPCSDGDACTMGEACDGNGTPTSCSGGTLLNCDDHVVCTEDFCDPETGCAYRMYSAGTSCSDGNACNGVELCDGNGECALGGQLDCNDNNPCTDDSCSPAAGCIHSNNTNSCNDGNACTRTDVCVNGACTGANPVICSTLDQCHTVGVCDPASGACSNPNQPNGTVCNDGSLCTTGETCQSGTCTPAFSGLNEPNPRSSGYYMRLCLGPHSGDLLTDADAVCVGQVATTFAGMTTVADLCTVLRPAHPNNDACDRTSADLMVLALNICRARVCTAQSIDSQCGDNANVGQSLAESDAILLSPSRDENTCAHAKCLDEEINTGRALELNTLGLRREGSGIRLDWRPPYLDDGTGHPSKYHVWRRVQGSLAPFTKIGTTTNPTYLDGSSAGGAFEYEVTAVMN